MNDPQDAADRDRRLSALLDDALPEDEARRLRRRIAAEPALARRLEQLRRADQAVRESLAGIADEPVPRRVRELLRASATQAPPRRRAGLARTAVTAGLALAAGFALAFVVLPRAQPDSALPLLAGGGGVLPGTALHAVLEHLPSGESRPLAGAWSAMPRLTFVGSDGRPCRRIDLSGADRGVQALACRADEAWQLELLGFTSGGPAQGLFRPATGQAARGIDAAIDARIDGAPLGREEERELIERGWRRDE